MIFDNQSENTADLSFNYDLIQGKEFEVLNYIAGDNWMKEKSRINSNITQNKNTVTVNGETRVVTVKTAGPQGAGFDLSLDHDSKVDNSIKPRSGNFSKTLFISG